MGNIAASYHRNHVSPATDRKIFFAIGGAGLFCAFTVFVEMCEKLAGAQSHNWSALRFMGPQIWLPLKTKEDYNVALIILIFSIMYAASCILLIYSGWKRVKDLSLTWKLTECGVLMYQIIAALITAKMFSAVDSVLLSVDTVLGVLALVYIRISESTWQEEALGEEHRRQPSPTPLQEEEVVESVPAPSTASSREARRSLEAVAGPSGVAGASGASRPRRAELQMEPIDADSDSLEDVGPVIEPPLQSRPVISPRRKKSSVRTVQVTVHSPPEDLQEIAVSGDAERTQGSIAEESISDRSHSSPSTSQTTPPRQPVGGEGSETTQEQVPHGPSTSTPEVTSTDQPLVTEALQEASPSTADVPHEASPRPPQSTETSQAPAETKPAQEHVSAGESTPLQQTSAAVLTSTDAETGEKPSATHTAASSLSLGESEAQIPAETDSSQVRSPVERGAAAAETKTGEESKAATETTTEEPVAEVVAEATETTHT